MSKFTKEYFIEKFKSIPDNLWLSSELTHHKNINCHCALGHCGVVVSEDGKYIMTEEADALGELLKPVSSKELNWESVYCVNDGIIPHLGYRPKERILKALNKI